MAAHYLANVGNRDLWLDDVPIAPERCRDQGEAILNDYDTYRDRLSAPIIEAGLQYVAGAEAGQALHVHLFGTNQESAADQHRARDTVNAANVLKRWLPDRFAALKVALRREDVTIVEIKENPSLHDQMYEFFGRRLGRGKLESAREDTWYVSPVGGVPAANFALLLRAVERYGAQCHPLYVPEGKTRPLPLDMSRQLLRTVLRGQARHEIEQMEFGRAARLLRDLGERPALVGLADHAAHRLHFDFHRARRALEEGPLAAPGPERELAMQLGDGLEELLRKDAPALIGELFCNLKLVYEAGRYVDFLLRVFRYQEAVLRLIVERELGATTEPTALKADAHFVAAIEADEPLRDELKRGGVDYEREPNTYSLGKIVQHLAGRSGEHQAQLQRAHQILASLERLAALRNRSIGAHGFQGVAREEVAQGYHGADLLADLRELGEVAGAPPSVDPFERVRAALLAGLERD